jgi:hypothetical protein
VQLLVGLGIGAVIEIVGDEVRFAPPIVPRGR